MGLALTGIIDFPTAAALVLGENIGTTITAYLASLGASVNAKRASYAHIILNTLGVIIVTAAFPLYIKLVLYMLGQDPTMTIYTETGTTYPHASAGIALTHTTFNVLNAIIWLPLMSLLVRFLNKIVPEKSFSEKPHLKYIDFRMVDAPAIAIEQSRKEIIWMSGVISKMLDNLRKVLNNGPVDTKVEEKIFEKERELDVVQKEVSEFLSHLLSGTVTQDVMFESRKQLRMADELESISDYITNILKLRLKLRDMSIDISSYGLEDLLDLHSRVKNYIEFINEALRTDNRQILTEAQSKGKVVTEVMKEHRSEHLTRVENGQVMPLKSLIYMDMLNAYRRIKDHAFNIAEVLSGEK
jgi:phosphate:Na+ symporter